MPLTQLQGRIVQEAVAILSTGGGVLLALHFGFGKTLVASEIIRQLSGPVAVLAPLSTQNAFKRELNTEKERISFFTLTANNYYSEIKDTLNIPCLIVVDEAHNLFRSILNEADQGNAFYRNCLCSKHHRFLFLTGHPVGKQAKEVNACINLLHNSAVVPLDRTLTQSQMIAGLQGRTFYLGFNPDNPFFPQCETHIVYVPLTPEHTRVVIREKERPHVTEQILLNNGLAEDLPGVIDFKYCKKAQEILRLISGKTLIYTSTKGWGGVQLIAKVLAEAAKKYHVFTGDISPGERDSVLEEFNMCMDDVLVMTNAGMEGINTIGVRTSIFFEPTWTYTQACQFKYRSIRYGSHLHLPIEDRHCQIYILCATLGTRTSVDEKKLNSIRKYQRDVARVTSAMKSVSILNR